MGEEEELDGESSESDTDLFLEDEDNESDLHDKIQKLNRNTVK